MRGVALLFLPAVVGCAAATAWAATPTRASWAAGANRICRLELVRLNALPRPQQGDVAGTVAFLQESIAIVNPLTKQIAALPRPVSERTLIQQWLATQWAAATQVRQLSDAVTAGDASRVATLLSAMQARGARADSLARRLGANVCALP